MEQWLGDLSTLFENDYLSGAHFGDLALAAAILVGVLLLRKVFTKVVIGFLLRLSAKTETKMDEALIEGIAPPLRFAFLLVGLYAALGVLSLDPGLHEFFKSILRSLVAFTVFWTIFRLIEPLSELLDTFTGIFGSSLTEDIKYFFVRVIKGIILFLGAMAVLQEWGVNVAAFLGGLGLAGMAVALAAKDTVSNLFGGLTIFADRVFVKGDWIETPFVEGTVEAIGLRATKIRSFAKARITVPNAKLADTAVINWTRMSHRRIKMTIGLEYKTTADQLERIIASFRKHLAEDPKVAQDVTQMVHAVGFAASSIDINLYYFTKTTDWLEWRDIVNDHMIDFKKIVEGEGTAFAFPSRTVYLENADIS
jgi:MscS family membrane protein